MSNYVHPSEIPDDIRRQLEDKRREKLGQEEGNLIYIGNLPLQVTEDDIKEVFADYGYVEFISKKIGRYVYVYMTNPNEAQKAVSSLNEAEWMGCTLIARKAALLDSV
jgi:RNA recognition motif-containing protein